MADQPKKQPSGSSIAVNQTQISRSNGWDLREPANGEFLRSWADDFGSSYALGPSFDLGSSYSNSDDFGSSYFDQLTGAPSQQPASQLQYLDPRPPARLLNITSQPTTAGRPRPVPSSNQHRQGVLAFHHQHQYQHPPNVRQPHFNPSKQLQTTQSSRSIQHHQANYPSVSQRSYRQLPQPARQRKGVPFASHSNNTYTVSNQPRVSFEPSTIGRQPIPAMPIQQSYEPMHTHPSTSSYATKLPRQRSKHNNRPRPVHHSEGAAQSIQTASQPHLTASPKYENRRLAPHMQPFQGHHPLTQTAGVQASTAPRQSHVPVSPEVSVRPTPVAGKKRQIVDVDLTPTPAPPVKRTRVDEYENPDPSTILLPLNALNLEIGSAPEHSTYRINAIGDRLYKFEPAPQGTYYCDWRTSQPDYSDPRDFYCPTTYEQSMVWAALRPVRGRYELFTGERILKSEMRCLDEGYDSAWNEIKRKFQSWIGWISCEKTRAEEAPSIDDKGDSGLVYEDRGAGYSELVQQMVPVDPRKKSPITKSPTIKPRDYFDNDGHQIYNTDMLENTLTKLERWYGLIDEYELSPTWPQLNAKEKHTLAMKNAGVAYFPCRRCQRNETLCYGHKEHEKLKCKPCEELNQECSKEATYVRHSSIPHINDGLTVQGFNDWLGSYRAPAPPPLSTPLVQTPEQKRFKLRLAEKAAKIHQQAAEDQARRRQSEKELRDQQIREEEQKLKAPPVDPEELDRQRNEQYDENTRRYEEQQRKEAIAATMRREERSAIGAKGERRNSDGTYGTSKMTLEQVQDYLTSRREPQW